MQREESIKRGKDIVFDSALRVEAETKMHHSHSHNHRMGVNLHTIDSVKPVNP